MAFHAVRERNPLLITEFVSESALRNSYKPKTTSRYRIYFDYSVIHKHLMRL